jgi:hypothetical protein
MHDVIPHAVRVKEIAEHVGWYAVDIHVMHTSIDVLISVDGIPSHARQYIDLWALEREGFAKQAIMNAVHEINTFVMEPRGFRFILPNIERV